MKMMLPIITSSLIFSTLITMHSRPKDTHIWILKQDSAIEIDRYSIGKCLPNPGTYCSYWTTTVFGFHSMPDSLFQDLLFDGYFTGHDFNRRYLP